MPTRFPKTYRAPVSSLMDPEPPRVEPEEPATRIRRLFRSTGARIVYVVGRDGSLYGQITRGDILVITSAKSNALAKHLAAEPVVTLSPGDHAGPAIERMLRSDEWYAPVLDSSRLVGQLGLESVIRSMVDEAGVVLGEVQVREIMTTDVVTASPDDFVQSIWDLMRKLRYAGLPVVDGKGRLVGVVTQYDLLARGARVSMESSSGPSRGPRVREVMTSSVEYVYPWDSVLKVASLILNRGFGRVPVVDSEPSRKLVGIVDREDIVRLLF